MKQTILFIFTFLCISNFGMAQTDEGRETDSKMIEVSRGIYMYQNRGGNIGLSVGNDGVLMIDDQFAEVSEDLLKDLKRLTKKPLEFVINTHHHGDHTGGNANMTEAGATVVSHENVRKKLKKYIDDNPSMKIDERMLPALTFTDHITFYYNAEEIVVTYMDKAHTDADVIVFFKNSNVIHTGDTYIKGRYPFIDKTSGGSVEGYMNGLETILSMIDRNTKVIPGHGDLADLQDVREMKRMMDIAWQRVTKMFLDDKSEVEIITSTSFTKEFDEKGYGDHMVTRQKFLKDVYDEVAIIYDQSDYKNRRDMIEAIQKKQKGGE